MSKDVTINIGAYSAEIVSYDAPPYKWVAIGFKMSGVYGLDIEARAYKYKSSAVRYARQQLQLKYDANQSRIRL